MGFKCYGFIPVVLYFILSFTCCSGEKDQLPDDVVKALDKAGENKTELLNVIDHYRELGDKQKLKACYFLIANMPGHYFSYNEPVSYFDKYFKLLGQQEKNKRMFVLDSLGERGLWPKEQLNLFYDINYITGDFLIDNIELSFKIWEQLPWQDEYSFELFCEYILPYRVNEEITIETWKSLFYNKYSNYYDTIKAKKSAKIIYGNLFKSIKTEFRSTTHNFYPTSVGLENLDIGKIGKCSDECNYLTARARVLGIPAVVDFIPYWADYRLGHEFNSLVLPDGGVLTNLDYEEPPQPYRNYVHAMRHFDDGYLLYYEKDTKNEGFKKELMHVDVLNKKLVYTKDIPEDIQIHSEKKAGKIYRRMYSIQRNSLAYNEDNKELLPKFLQNTHIKDVTSDYFDCSDVKIKLKRGEEKNHKYMFLCVFKKNGVYPISGSEINNKKATFRDMETEVLYFPMFYNDGEFYSATDPVYVEKNGDLTFLKNQNTTTETITVKRKFPLTLRMVYYANYMLHGRFEAANNPEFKDAVVLAEINKTPYYWTEKNISNVERAYRYVRYVNDSSFGDVGEIAFYSKTNEKLQKLEGKIISSDEDYVYPPERALDGIMGNFRRSKVYGSWVGYDFGKPKNLNKIRFCPRNDTNEIMPGDTYELFYWDNGWKSMGKQKANTNYLSYKNVPVGALLWLVNHSGGNEERPFVMENGIQKWL